MEESKLRKCKSCTNLSRREICPACEDENTPPEMKPCPSCDVPMLAHMEICGDCQVDVLSELRRRSARETVDDKRAVARARMPLGFPDDDGSLAEDLAEEEPKIRFAVDGLAGIGHVVSMPSTRKTGKTTFLANLAACGVGGGKFLGQFQTHLQGNVGIWNAEMERLDYTDVFRPLPISEPRRIKTLHLRGQSVPFLSSDSIAEQTVKWLTVHDVEWWFLDPWKNVCAWNQVKMNDGDRVQALLSKIQDIQKQAGVALVVIPMHTTQAMAEDGFERGKGAGEFEDGVDVMWRYVKVAPQRDACRVLTVEGRGRGIGLDETQVLFDSGTGFLSLGDGNRYDAREAKMLEEVVSAVEGFRLNTGKRPNSTQIVAMLHGRKQNVLDALKDAEAKGVLRSEKIGPTLLWELISAPVPVSSGNYGNSVPLPIGELSGTDVGTDVKGTA